MPLIEFLKGEFNLEERRKQIIEEYRYYDEIEHGHYEKW